MSDFLVHLSNGERVLVSTQRCVDDLKSRHFSLGIAHRQPVIKILAIGDEKAVLLVPSATARQVQAETLARQLGAWVATGDCGELEVHMPQENLLAFVEQVNQRVKDTDND